MPNPFQMPSLASHPAEAGGGNSGGANFGGAKRRGKPKNKNMLIIRRLNRISLSVSIIWLLLAAANIATWAHFRLFGDVKDLRWLLILRLVLLRCVNRSSRCVIFQPASGLSSHPPIHQLHTTG